MLRDGCAARAARHKPFTTPAWWRRWKHWSIRHARRPDGAVALDLQQCGAAWRGELEEAGHRGSELLSVNWLLHELGYSLQANRKTLEGKQHAVRDAQFNCINRRVRAVQRQRQPVVSVDTKTQELVGPFKNGGRELAVRTVTRELRFAFTIFRPRHSARRFRTACTYLTRDAGWVSVGVDH